MVIDRSVSSITANTTVMPELVSSSTQSVFSFLRHKLEPTHEVFLTEMARLLDSSSFEYGFSNEAELYVRRTLKDYPEFARGWLNELFVKCFPSSDKLGKFLRIIAHLDAEELGSVGQTFCVASLIHEDVEIKEQAVRVIENWGQSELAPLLSSIETGTRWLDDYIQQVARELAG